MKMYLLILLAVAVVVSVVACTSKKKPDVQIKDSAPKYLVIYYSQTGVTKAVAEEIQKKLGADIDSIEVSVPYDGSYQETIDRCLKEMNDGITPKVKSVKANLSAYDVVFLGYPIWFGTYALPIAGLVKDYDFSGKLIVPFCTFGSGGLESSVSDLRKALPNAKIMEGYGVRSTRLASAPKEIDRFLKENQFIDGEVEKLAEYSVQQPVTDEEKAIFDAACGNYQFPLGTPETVGKRATADGTDYKFVAKGKNINGEETSLTIYVTVGNEPDATPEFTRVARK